MRIDCKSGRKARSLMSLTTDPRAFLTSLFRLAVSTADPMQVVAPHLPARPRGRVLVIGAGKASARMAEAVEAAWGPCEGLVITRYGYARPCRGIEIVEAAHPVPDAAGEAATHRILDLVSDCRYLPPSTLQFTTSSTRSALSTADTSPNGTEPGLSLSGATSVLPDIGWASVD